MHRKKQKVKLADKTRKSEEKDRRQQGRKQKTDKERDRRRKRKQRIYKERQRRKIESKRQGKQNTGTERDSKCIHLESKQQQRKEGRKQQN